MVRAGIVELAAAAYGVLSFVPWLVQLSALRDQLVTPLAPALLLAGVLQAGWRRTRRHPGLSACALFLALFSSSQVLVSLLGAVPCAGTKLLTPGPWLSTPASFASAMTCARSSGEDRLLASTKLLAMIVTS